MVPVCILLDSSVDATKVLNLSVPVIGQPMQTLQLNTRLSNKSWVRVLLII